MRSFIAGCVAAIIVAIVAGFALDAIQKPADSAFSTVGTRL
jgi:hypothetical protein